MQSALIVYIALTVLLAVPIVWFGAKNLLDRKSKQSQRIGMTALAAVLLLALLALGTTLYQFTLRSQPLLVIDQFATQCQAGATRDSLVSDGLLSPEASDLDAALAALQAGDPVVRLSKPEEDSETYNLLVNEDAPTVVQITLQQSGNYYVVSQATLLPQADAATAVEEQSFTEVH